MAFPDLKEAEIDLLLLNSSGGKDSSKMLTEADEAIREQNFPRDQVVVVHADLGRMEWDGARELATEQAEHYGFRFEYEKRPQGDLLDHARKRGKWYAPQQRYCTSDHKRAQVSKIVTRLTNELRAQARKTAVRMLNCMGMRAAESPGRAKKKPLAVNNRLTNTKREVYDCLPIHQVTDDEAWDYVDNPPVRQADACYGCGLGRFSCKFCIYMSQDEAVVSGQQPENYELLQEMVRAEEEMDHTFWIEGSLREVDDRIQSGEVVELVRGRAWNM